MNSFKPVYGKCTTISITLFHTFWPKFCIFMQLFLKLLNGLANSVDSDQTQEQSDLVLQCLQYIRVVQ